MTTPNQIEQGEKSTLKLARRIIDAVLKSPCVVETRCFSQPDEVDLLEVQIAAMLPSLAEKQEEIEKLKAALRRIRAVDHFSRSLMDAYIEMKTAAKAALGEDANPISEPTGE